MPPPLLGVRDVLDLQAEVGGARSEQRGDGGVADGVRQDHGAYDVASQLERRPVARGSRSHDVDRVAVVLADVRQLLLGDAQQRGQHVRVGRCRPGRGFERVEPQHEQVPHVRAQAVQAGQGEQVADCRGLRQPVRTSYVGDLAGQHLQRVGDAGDDQLEALLRVRRRHVQGEPVEYGEGACAHGSVPAFSETETERTQTTWPGSSFSTTSALLTRRPSSTSSTW